MLSQLPAPPLPFDGETRYTIRARDKRAFNTVLDAKNLIDPSGSRHSVARLFSDGDDIVLSLSHPIVRGTIAEELRCGRRDDHLVAQALVRSVIDEQGKVVRREEVHDFHHETIGLPDATYPEVALPFLIGWFPFDKTRRSLYAWINDRFVARVYVEVQKRLTIAVPAGAREVVQVQMYPDLNDWVRLGRTLTALAKPLVPKYRMWFDARSPYRLVRYEGPYGPPGAPEVELELCDEQPIARPPTGDPG